jgi:hypothetical protein
VIYQSNVNSPAYLRIADFYAAGWVQVQSDNLDECLLLIWNLLIVKTIEIVQQNLSNVLVISKEEHKIEAHWK